jgi:hypothetical protein
MRTPVIVPLDPLPDRRFCLCEAMKAMLPDTLLFQAPEESLDDPVLLGGIGGDELLPQPVVPTSRPEPPALEDQPVVAPHHRGFAGRPQGSKAGDTGLLDGSFGLLRSTPQSQPSRPQSTWVRSIALRRSLLVVRLTEAFTRGRGVTAR